MYEIQEMKWGNMKCPNCGVHIGDPFEEGIDLVVLETSKIRYTEVTCLNCWKTYMVHRSGIIYEVIRNPVARFVYK